MKRVYRYRNDGSIAACAFADGTELPLDSPADDHQAFPPPSIDLAGPVVAYAVQDCSESSCYTDVLVEDLRYVTGTDAPARAHRRARAGIDRRAVKVGSLRLRRNGAVAWTTCPGSPFQDGTFIATQRPTCVRPGALDRVIKLDAGTTHRKVLDRSRKIDPSSLRLKAGRISWVRAGSRRSARLR